MLGKRQKVSLHDIGSDGAGQVPLNLAGIKQLNESLAAKIRPDEAMMIQHPIQKADDFNLATHGMSPMIDPEALAHLN